MEKGWEEVSVEEIRRYAMYTGALTGTCVVELLTSGIRMRMQPCEAAEPIEPESSVPWMPAPA